MNMRRAWTLFISILCLLAAATKGSATTGGPDPFGYSFEDSNAAQGPVFDWIEISSRDKTCGGISPGDLWLAPSGEAHVVWTERAIDERLRDKFFPGAPQSHAVNYARVRDGRIL